MSMSRKFMIEGSLARNMISKSNKDLSMADVTSERVNKSVLKVHERVLLGQKRSEGQIWTTLWLM